MKAEGGNNMHRYRKEAKGGRVEVEHVGRDDDADVGGVGLGVNVHLRHHHNSANAYSQASPANTSCWTYVECLRGRVDVWHLCSHGPGDTRIQRIRRGVDHCDVQLALEGEGRVWRRL